MAKKSDKYFTEVNLNADFPQIERDLLKSWYEGGLIAKYLTKNAKQKKNFSFMDGPITANNPMGVHHAWGRSYKDLWQKFKNMQGYKQRFQNGFDCQGLWVEVEVEKELGFTNKKQIEDYGVSKFVEKCKERVAKFAAIQTEQSKRLGYFMDWENSYYTLSDANNYMIWHFIKVCSDHGWLYKGNDSVPWCPRCETAISQHEVLTEDYKEVVHDSVYFALPVLDKKNEYLLVWTTTPWTIPANIAVAVDEKLDYVLVNFSDKNYWVAKDVVQKVFGESATITKTAKGLKLVGLKYSGPFDDLPEVKKLLANPKFHTVVATDDRLMPINTEEGTGLVHTAVSAGTEDYRLGQKHKLPMIPVIADDASYLSGLGFLTGKNAKKHPEIVLDYLHEKGFTFKIEKYKHRYPGCWRCKTELVWKVTDEWYIAMDRDSVVDKLGTLRSRMLASAKKIKWIPKFGLKRELDWLNNMHDWLISKKNRYWGLCLPIWECKDCGNFSVYGSKAELKKHAVSGWEEFDGHSPHKPFIDFVKVKCTNCGSTASRIEPVGNPWLDAGIVTFSTIAKDNKGTPLYLSDKKAWKEWAPVDFITESFPGQFKNWFYSLIAMSTVLENSNPTKTILGFATLLAEDGRPMHKSWGNSIEFTEGADKIGVDVMRWMYARQNPTENMLFGYRLADETRRRFYLKLWNVYNFFVTYANINGFTPKKVVVSKNLLDKWISARLNDLIEKTTDFLENYKAFEAANGIEEFVDDLSNWYIRRSRERTGVKDSKESSLEFYSTTYAILETLSRLLAPFMPFITDVIYTNLTKKASVHLSDWPKSTSLSSSDQLLLSEMARLREFVELVHAKRKAESLAVKRPILELNVTSKDKPFLAELLTIAKDELNIKQINWKSGKRLSLHFDLTLTDELTEELKTRELIRAIQNERKTLGLDLSQKTKVEAPWIPVATSLFQEVLTVTQSTSLTQGSALKVSVLRK